ncbi:PAAR domain-containing protein [Pseudomonas akapageensis]|uniref:PAAR domain-containing protein n=1 Tax=Pseudomonas akapageensis TaxID=2609961 RepID=UPI001409F41E|nr:PAAR domain-containing protein [Pseudomonas akapageensis]
MAKGHFIRLGDKTTCGGTVQEADSRVMMFGFAHAREGDRVTCGKDGKTYVIAGGVSYITSNGRRVAGHLDSFSNCPCKAQLIPSIFNASYESSQSAGPQATRTAAQPAAPAPSSPSIAPRHSSFAPSSNPAPVVFKSAERQEPGFYIVPKSMTKEQLEASLFTVRDPAVMHKFQLLNPNLHDVKAGSMIVLSDPGNIQCTREEALLMEAASKVDNALKPLSAQEADFMARHRDEIETFLSEGSTAIGIGELMLSKHLKNVKVALMELEKLHQTTFQQHGTLNTPAFFAERNRLMSQLDSSLGPLLHKGAGIPDHPKLKHALGISSRSLVHHWSKAGAPGSIPGYTTHIEGVAKASKYIEMGGWVGFGLGVSASAFKVLETCRVGREDECRSIKFTESGKFAGEIAGGAAGGWAGGLVCIGLGITTGVGGLACGLVMAGLGSAVVGNAAGEYGEVIGEVLYESMK